MWTVQPMRLFTAVEIENAGALSRIVEFRDSVATCFSKGGFKPVQNKNIHITLKFIGEVDEPSLPEIERCMEKVSMHASFEISIEGVGTFPSLSRPRVIWVGVSEGFERLKLLRNTMEPCLRPYAKPDRASFVPHITVGRVKGGVRGECLKEVLEAYRETFFGKSPVTEVKLKRSFLKPSGPEYVDVLTVKLRG